MTHIMLEGRLPDLLDSDNSNLKIDLAMERDGRTKNLVVIILDKETHQELDSLILLNIGSEQFSSARQKGFSIVDMQTKTKIDVPPNENLPEYCIGVAF